MTAPILRTQKTACRVPAIIASLLVTVASQAYEVRIAEVALSASTQTDTTRVLIRTDKPAGDWDGIKLSFVADRSIDLGPWGWNILSANMQTEAFLVDDVQRIEKLSLLVKADGIRTEVITLPGTNTNPITLTSDWLGRPSLVNPDWISADARFLYNWYVTQYMSYLEIIPLGTDVTKPMVVAYGYAGLGPSLGHYLATPGIASNLATLEIDYQIFGNAPIILGVAGIRNTDLIADLNDNYATRVSPPAVVLTQAVDWSARIHKSRAAWGAEVAATFNTD